VGVLLGTLVAVGIDAVVVGKIFGIPERIGVGDWMLAHADTSSKKIQPTFANKFKNKLFITLLLKTVEFLKE
jgi:hypothetical protein